MSKKILLVDDDPGAHVIIVPILSKAGYLAISAKNGEQALHLALNERPDLIILDVIMPCILLDFLEYMWIPILYMQATKEIRFLPILK